MALHWRIEECNMSDEFKQENWTTIEEMIFLTMIIDIGKITTKNLDTVEYRLRVYSKVSGTDYTRVIKLLPQLVGLTTNVSDKTDKQFEKRMLEILIRDTKYEVSRDKNNKESN